MMVAFIEWYRTVARAIIVVIKPATTKIHYYADLVRRF